MAWAVLCEPKATMQAVSGDNFDLIQQGKFIQKLFECLDSHG
jgi:hypothetical protein